MSGASENVDGGPHTRGPVIAHWRAELSAAEEAQRGEGGNHAWLARMRVRLYRFLLACYAAGPWGARPQGVDGEAELPPDTARPPVGDDRQGRETIGPAYISPAGWTHVRQPGKIAAVLKAVAGAQEPHVAGPLVHGLAPDSWVALAAESSHVDLERLAHILKNNDIEQRVRTCGDDRVLEVRACDRARAAYWLGLSAGALRTRFNRQSGSVPLIAEILFLGFVLGLGGIPLVAFLLPLLSWWLLGRTPSAEAWRLTQAGAIPVGIFVGLWLFVWFTIRAVRWRASTAFDRPVRIVRSGK